jgi:predicted ABC-type transport system involved in lysophospholipase L1 biosynthesis ATPase subunit
LSDDDRTRLRREKVGMIFQSFNLLPTLSALENVSLPLRLRNGSRREAEKRAREMLERVGLHRQATHRPDEMSGGECQRVAIARALISIPRCFLLTSRLGISTQPVVKVCCNSLMNYTANLTTPSFSSHTIDLRQRVANAMLILRDGRVAQDSAHPSMTDIVLTESL